MYSNSEKFQDFNFKPKLSLLRNSQTRKPGRTSLARYAPQKWKWGFKLKLSIFLGIQTKGYSLVAGQWNPMKCQNHFHLKITLWVTSTFWIRYRLQRLPWDARFLIETGYNRGDSMILVENFWLGFFFNCMNVFPRVDCISEK